MAGEVGEKPREYAEEEGGAEEFEGTKKGVDTLQGESGFGRHDEYGRVEDFAV